MARKFGEGDEVAVTGGRHKGIVGRVTKPTDITTSKNEIQPRGTTRKIRVTSKNAEKLAEPKQTFFGWLLSK
jgi:preprotein translocase subunit YajC